MCWAERPSPFVALFYPSALQLHTPYLPLNELWLLLAFHMIPALPDRPIPTIHVVVVLCVTFVVVFHRVAYSCSSSKPSVSLDIFTGRRKKKASFSLGTETTLETTSFPAPDCSTSTDEQYQLATAHRLRHAVVRLSSGRDITVSWPGKLLSAPSRTLVAFPQRTPSGWQAVCVIYIDAGQLGLSRFSVPITMWWIPATTNSAEGIPS